MGKKIFMLVFLMLVLISVSAVSAADLDDNNNMVVSSYDVEILSSLGLKEVRTGEFGADMQVEICNDGPVTVMLDTEEWKRCR